MQEIKAIFFDVDGTLLSFATHRMSPAVRQALYALREKGIKLFVATGRHMRWLDPVREAFPLFDGWITLSGQYCTCGGQVVHRNPLSREAAAELVAAAREENFSCIFLTGEEIFLNQVDERTRIFAEEHGVAIPPADDPRRALTEDVYQGIVLLSREDESRLTARAPHLKTTRWHRIFLDAIPSGGGKDKGIDAVLAHLGIPLEAAMAFGDGENDLSMLTHVGLGVAMGSASEAVKAQADYVTGPVDEDGIVTALEHFGLLE